jgi:hypothetical protein
MTHLFSNGGYAGHIIIVVVVVDDKDIRCYLRIVQGLFKLMYIHIN